MSSAADLPPGPPPPLTKDQIARIRRAPIHRRIKHAVYGALALAVVGALANVTCLILGAVWARNIVAVEKWFIFHYVCAAVLSTMWLGYSLVFERHIKFMAFPDQLQIDMGWMMFAVVFSSAWHFYLFRKMQQYGVLDMFVVTCSSGCTTKLNFVKLSPLILGITTLVLGAVQLLLGLALYRNPIINPPLDSHGMPIPQDPETGRPMPLDAKGQPVLPEWLLPRDLKTGELLPCDASGNLLPPSASRKASSASTSRRTAEKGDASGTDSERKGDSSAGDDSDEDKSLLERKGAMQELGRSAGRDGRRERRSRRSERR
ncbi:hypothetical protein JCM9279_001268 [Rhodotorula babjevae]